MVDPSSTPRLLFFLSPPLGSFPFFFSFVLITDHPYLRIPLQALYDPRNFPSSRSRETASRRPSPSSNALSVFNRHLCLARPICSTITQQRYSSSSDHTWVKIRISLLISTVSSSSSIHLRSRPKTRVLRIISGDPSTHIFFFFFLAFRFTRAMQEVFFFSYTRERKRPRTHLLLLLRSFCR